MEVYLVADELVRPETIYSTVGIFDSRERAEQELVDYLSREGIVGSSYQGIIEFELNAVDGGALIPDGKE